MFQTTVRVVFCSRLQIWLFYSMYVLVHCTLFQVVVFYKKMLLFSTYSFKNSLLRCRGCTSNSCRDFKCVPVVNDSEPAFKIPCSAVDAVTVVRIPWFGTALRIPCSAVDAVTAVRIPWFGTALRIPCSAVEAVTAVRIPCPTSC